MITDAAAGAAALAVIGMLLPSPPSEFYSCLDVMQVLNLAGSFPPTANRFDQEELEHSFLPNQSVQLKQLHPFDLTLRAVAQSLGLGVLLSALIEFVSDRTFLHQVMKAGLLEHSIPSYFAANRPASAFALAHPLLVRT